MIESLTKATPHQLDCFLLFFSRLKVSIFTLLFFVKDNFLKRSRRVIRFALLSLPTAFDYARVWHRVLIFFLLQFDSTYPCYDGEGIERIIRFVSLRPNITQTWFRGRYIVVFFINASFSREWMFAVLLSLDLLFIFNNLIICTLIHKSSLPNCFTFLLGTRFRLNENEFSKFERTANLPESRTEIVEESAIAWRRRNSKDSL